MLYALGDYCDEPTLTWLEQRSASYSPDVQQLVSQIAADQRAALRQRQAATCDDCGVHTGPDVAHICPGPSAARRRSRAIVEQATRLLRGGALVQGDRQALLVTVRERLGAILGRLDPASTDATLIRADRDRLHHMASQGGLN